MTTPKSRCCGSPRLRSAAAVLGLGFLLGLGAAPPLAAQPAVPAVNGATEELYLAVSLNGESLPNLSRFLVGPGGRLAASAATLREIGLRWPGSEGGTGIVELATLTGLQAHYDAANQQVNLVAPVAMLDRLPLQLTSGLAATQPAPLSPPVPGLLFNYDLFGLHSDGASSLSGWSEVRLFGLGPGLWTTSMSTAASHGPAGTRHSSVRLDTAWQLNWPDQAVSLTLGDSITAALSWSRPVRIGGIRLARNFELQPYQVTAPLSSFVGEAALPSTVDLYINGLRQSSQRVPPGQFQIDSLPSLNGAGRAEMVITDINGQRRVLDFDFYGAPQLLRQGLADWSASAGFVREDYGLKSSSYHRSLVGSGSLRYGLSDHLTLEAQAQAASDLLLGGAGGLWRLGERAGVLAGSVAASRAETASGRQATLGYQWVAQPYSLGVNTLRRSAGWRDIASRFDTRQVRGFDLMYAGLTTTLGQFGLSYVRQAYGEGGDQRFVTLNWSRQIGEASLNVNVLKDLEREADLQVQLAVHVPLDTRRSIGASATQQGGRNTVSVNAQQTVDGSAGGWGWRVQAGGGGDGVRAQAEVTRMGSLGQWLAGVSGGGDEVTTTYGGASGSVVWMGGGIRPMRRVDDAFALVSTAGVPDVPVRLENRLMGRTDGQGLLLIPQLNAYQRNQIAIDTLDLPPDMRADRVTAEAVPASRSGTLVRFGLRRVTAVQLSLRDAQGVPLPVGTAVALLPPAGEAAAAATAVGYDGLIYLEDPPAGLTLRADLPEGACKAALPAALEAGWIDLGPLTCRR
jgi:outer membrane usher protein